MDVATAWKLWWLGNPAQKLIPFSNIKLFFLPSRLLKNILAEWTYLMSRMEQHFEETVGHKIPKNPSEIVVAEAFDVAKHLLDPIFVAMEKKRKRRSSQLKVLTAVKLMRTYERTRKGSTTVI